MPRLIYYYLTNLFKSFSNSIPKPHAFITQPLQSNIDLSEILTEINTLLPQLANFINQFNTSVSQAGINVLTDSMGNLSIDVPQNMPDSVANNVSTRIGIIDRLITTRGEEINDLLKRGINIERDLKRGNPKYVSELTSKILEYKRLKASYIHI